MAAEPTSSLSQLENWKKKSLSHTTRPKEFLLVFSLITLAYSLGILIDKALSINSLSPLYTTSGIGISALLFFGKRYWPAILLASLLSYTGEAQSAVSIFCLTSANIIEAILGARLILYFSQIQKKYGFHSDSIALIGGAPLGIIVSVLIHSCLIYFTKTTSLGHILHFAFVNIAGNFLSVLLILPFFLSLIHVSPDKPPRLIEIGLLVIGIFFGYFILFQRENSSYLFFIFPFILLSSIVFQDRFSKLLTIVLCFSAITLTQLGTGPLYFESADLNLVNLQVFLLGVSVSALVFSDFKQLDILRTSGMIILLGSGISSLIFFTTYSLDQQKIQIYFDALVKDSLGAVQLQMQTNLSLLRSGAGLLSVSHNVNRAEWKEFVKQLKLNEVAPSIQGLGLIYRVERSRLNKFIKKAQDDGAPNFAIKRFSDINHHPTDAFILSQAEPDNSNRAAEGLDMSTEKKRYEAAILAAETGNMSISESVILTINPLREHSFLIYYPFYFRKEDLGKPVTKLPKNIGWIAAPVLAKNFFAAAWSGPVYKSLLYSVREPETGQALASSTDFYTTSDHFYIKHLLKVANRTYEIHFKPSKEFELEQSNTSWVGLSAAILSILLSVFTAIIQLGKKRAELIVEERTQQLEMTGQMAKLGGWEYDVENNNFILSKSAKQIYGVTKQLRGNLQVGLSFYKEGPSRNKISEAIEASIQSAIPFDLELEFVNDKGEERWVRTIGEALQETGKVTRVYGAIQDITERVKLELEKSFIVESLNLGLWKYNPNTKALIWDKSMFSLYGIDPKNFKGTFSDWENTVDEDSMEEILVQLDKALRGESDFNTVFKIKHPEGIPRYIGARAIVTRDKNGNPIDMYGINWDRTNEILLEHQLMQERVKSLHSVKLASLGEMSAGIAHEINNPLSIISGSTELLIKLKNNPDKVSEKALLIQKAAERIERIVSGLNKFSRNSVQIDHSPHPLSDIIDEALRLIDIKIKKSAVRMETQLNSKAQIMCDRFEIEQVFVNLLSNAIDAAQESEENWVKIESFDNDNQIVLRVIDSGPGISDKNKNKIFEPFFTTKKVGEGTGLGLSIAKGILDEHNASIHLNTDLGYTCFEVRFNKAEGTKNA